MIGKHNLHDFLTALNFSLGRGSGSFCSFSKTINGATLEVDTVAERIIYPEAQGLLVNERQTCNFSANENFVVLECVHRLLEKGYKPEHIELEPKWKLGRGASGGRADILVKDNDGRPLLIIECKTPGTEFDRAWRKTLQDGDQLFSYAQQISETQFLCLYCSDFDGQHVEWTSHLIAHRDNLDYLARQPDLPGYKDASSVEERFRVWRDTYQQEFTTQGLFEDSIQPYLIGKDKYTLADLKTIAPSDQQKKYHEFATILRQHNVSGRENAFDKLVNLFLCKIVDETSNPTDLKFHWKGLAYDTHFDLMDRLQQLYQEGMGKFLGEPITYINQDQVFNAMRFIRRDMDATQRAVWDLFVQQKFFTNNDFSFIDVHNEKLFYQNAEILLKILQMWQDIRLTNPNGHNQFLGDMFEGFLDQGVKQSEGQYFTPMPICRFIMMSLPLESLVQASATPPKAIDYACGAGHFLNELALQLKPLVEQHQPQQPLANYHRAIFGIEKEYRLSKVAKVSAFMYGQQDINICYGDALVRNHPAFEGIRDNSFDLLVANPPYSVRGFLETLPEEERAAYSLSKTIDRLDSSNSIETFFIERAKQLLKAGGIAAIILPASILSNGGNTYIKTREILLQYFDIVAIVEFGSGTFGKTGTNTVTLFLRRKKTAPDTAVLYRERVAEWFTVDIGQEIYRDAHLIERYAGHIGVPLADYRSLLAGDAQGAWRAHEHFAVYEKAFATSSEIKGLRSKKWFKALDQAGQTAELDKRYLDFVREIEQDKLYHFVMASDQRNPVLIIKSPSDSKAQKQFLGYDWSSAKGDEGIKLVKDAKGRHITPLYDESDRNNAAKLNRQISKNFSGKMDSIPSDLEKYAFTENLTKLLSFSQSHFDKRFTLSASKAEAPPGKWPQHKIESLLIPVTGATTKIEESLIKENGEIPVITQSRQDLIAGYTNGVEPIVDIPLIVFGDHTCALKYIDFKFVRGADGTQLIKLDKTKALEKYAYYFLQHVNIANAEKYERHFKYLKSESIPLPPLSIQQSIISECSRLDDEESSARQEIISTRKLIEQIAIKQYFSARLLKPSAISEINPSKSELRKIDTNTLVSFVEMSSVSENGFITNMKDRPLESLKQGGYTYFINDDIIIAKITPCMENGKCALAKGLTNGIGMGSSEFHVIRADKTIILPEYLFLLLNRQEIRKAAAQVMTGKSGHRRVPASFYEALELPVPSLSEQAIVVAEVEALQQRITEAQAIIDSTPARKQAVLQQYL